MNSLRYAGARVNLVEPGVRVRPPLALVEYEHEVKEYQPHPFFSHAFSTRMQPVQYAFFVRFIHMNVDILGNRR